MDTIIQKLNIELNQNKFYIKRDDLIPQYYGGNKVRIVEEYYKDMVKRDCNCFITYGSKNSNMCRVVSLLCVEKNIPCFVIYGCEDIVCESRIDRINDIIVKNTGANIINCSKANVKEAIDSVFEYTKEKGYNPYYIYGNSMGKGNEKIGIQGYVYCYGEIKKYVKRKGREFDYVFVVSGTGITQAGLIAGEILNEGKEKIIGISIARERKVQEQKIFFYLKEYFDIAKQRKSNLIEVYDSVLQGGYGRIDDENKRFIINMSIKNNIPLDFTYVGKGMLGMLRYLREKKIYGKNILFIHTGSTPIFYEDMLNTYSDIKK